MRVFASLPVLVLASSVLAHGGHTHGGPAVGETMQEYAQRHMSSEHHIDTFDVGSFFQLHDLDSNGFWARDEIEAVYGVHHVYARGMSKDQEEQQRKADQIVKEVLKTFDLDNDGKITLDELRKTGLDKLPNFDHLGAEGHHYDIESEFFLHHEGSFADSIKTLQNLDHPTEKYHNTPETQTDESYNHPEDLEHFSHHEKIEQDEVERLAKFQGISVEEVLKYYGKPPAASQDETPSSDPIQPPKPKIMRVTPPEKQEPSVKFKNAEAEAKKKDDWGSGDAGYVAPRDASDRLRKNLPYKYKFRRNWGDF
ncbi:hypothetical protein APHAL10511_003161 [Amanita phalloides]|nr:hypothetical protein APHAL10511_003161 [Amanita phalloides]